MSILLLQKLSLFMLLYLGNNGFSGVTAAEVQQIQSNENPVTNELVVYKSPNCGCCGDWIEHMKENGFDVKVHNSNSMPSIKVNAGITPELASCHTAFIDGKVIEGHVPASDIKRMLTENSTIKGLAVPGMPAGANVPGMEVTHKNADFKVLSFNKEGETKTWSQYQ